VGKLNFESRSRVEFGARFEIERERRDRSDFVRCTNVKDVEEVKRRCCLRSNLNRVMYRTYRYGSHSRLQVDEIRRFQRHVVGFVGWSEQTGSFEMLDLFDRKRHGRLRLRNNCLVEYGRICELV
jgi:hypothetical protein